MKTLLFNDNELELLKVILKEDIDRQKKQLEDIRHDIRFETWLAETEILLNKVNKALY